MGWLVHLFWLWSAVSLPSFPSTNAVKVSVFVIVEEGQGGVYLHNCLVALESLPGEVSLNVTVLISGEIGYQKRHTLLAVLSQHPRVSVIIRDSLCVAYNDATLQAAHSGEFILLLSDFVELRNASALKLLMSHLNEHGGLVGGKLEYLSGVVRDVGVDYVHTSSHGAEFVPQPFFRFAGVRTADLRAAAAVRVLGVSRAFAMLKTRELKLLADAVGTEVRLFDCDTFHDSATHFELDLALALKFRLEHQVWWIPEASALVYGSDEDMDIGAFDPGSSGGVALTGKWGAKLDPLLRARWHTQDVRLVWNMECGVGEVLGFTTEAVNFLTGLEGRLPSVQVETGNTHGCVHDLLQAGFPSFARAAMKRMLEREQPRNPSVVTVLVIHRDAGRYPSFLHYVSPGEKQVAVGRSMFETDKIEDNWVRNSNREAIHEIWVPSHFNVKTFASSGVNKAKLRVVGECVDVFHYDPLTVSPLQLDTASLLTSLHKDTTPFARPLIPPNALPLSRDSPFSASPPLSSSSSSSPPSLVLEDRAYSFAPSTFRVLSIGKWELRKGWLTLLEAFYEAFSAHEDAVLMIRAHLDQSKLNDLARFQQQYIDKRNLRARDCMDCGAAIRNESELGRVVVLQQLVPFAELPSLYRAAHCFVLPSHGEGWGLPLLEAMRMGLPTLATNYSGNTEFMNSNNSYLVRVHAMVDHPNLPGHKWAEASVPHMRHILRCLYQQHHRLKEQSENCEDVADSKAITQQAMSDVARLWSQEALAEHILDYLERLKREALLLDADRRRHQADAQGLKDWQQTIYREAVQFHHSANRQAIRVN